MPIMRSTLIALSRSKALQDLIVRVPVSRHAARRFVAGETLVDAIAAVIALNQQGMLATLDHLGENVLERGRSPCRGRRVSPGAGSDRGCGRGVQRLRQADPDGPRPERRLLLCECEPDRAPGRRLGNFVRVDMEGSPYTERTIDLYRGCAASSRNVGIVIQAYLHRSQADVEALIDDGDGPLPAVQGRLR